MSEAALPQPMPTASPAPIEDEERPSSAYSLRNVTRLLIADVLNHRVWGVRNLFVCDGSVMPTQGSANPALTIMALAARLAERLAARRVEANGRRAA